MAVATFTKTGTKAATSATLPKTVFGEEVTTHELLHRAFVIHHAGLRANSAHTLDRGEVRGGGRKPWRQKGTGRARHGSIRSPIWRGGGVTFGPGQGHNYQKQLAVGAKRKAIRQALTLSAQDGSLSIIEDFTVADGKTKTAASLLKKLDLGAPLLLVVDKKAAELDQAVRNLEDVELVTARHLSVYRLVNAGHVLLTKGSLAVLESWLSPATKPATKTQPKLAEAKS